MKKRCKQCYTGALRCRYDYDASGSHKVCGADGTELSSDKIDIGNINPFRYRGYYWDREFNLYYLRTGYYDPVLSRLISPDGVDYIDPESVNGLNLYAYCGNNHVMYADPSGHSWNSFWKGVGNWFKDAGQWVNDKVIQPIGNFFSDTVPDFFVNTVYEQGLKPAWDAMANFFVNTVWNDFMVGTIYQKGLLAAWNWTKNTAVLVIGCLIIGKRL